MLLLSGEPLDEPIVEQSQSVMNRRDCPSYHGLQQRALRANFSLVRTMPIIPTGIIFHFYATLAEIMSSWIIPMGWSSRLMPDHIVPPYRTQMENDEKAQSVQK